MCYITKNLKRITNLNIRFHLVLFSLITNKLKNKLVEYTTEIPILKILLYRVHDNRPVTSLFIDGFFSDFGHLYDNIF